MTDKQLTLSQIEQAIKDGLKQAYSKTSTPCVTNVETCLKIAVLSALNKQ